MSKTIDAAAAEAAVRKTAAAFKAALDDAAAAGLHVTWPTRVVGLDALAISETGKARVAVMPQVSPTNPLPAATVQAATEAAQKAADAAVAAAAAPVEEPKAEDDKAKPAKKA